MSYYDTIVSESLKYNWGLILIYDDVLKNVINSVLREFGECDILEIGAWRCQLWGWIKSNFDINKYNIRYTGIDIIDVGCPTDGIEFYVMSPTYLMFRPETFNLVITIETLEHITDYVLTLRECYRVLKPKGILFIQSVKCDDPNALNDRTHVHVLHPVTLARLLTHLGFKRVEHGGNGNFWLVAYK